jgi:hypothetical protein
MSTGIEEHLTDALRARADLVQPEDLRHLTLPAAAATPIRRRPAVVGLVAAAAAVAAVVVPTVLREDHNADHPLPPTSGVPTPVHSLSGDVDGDGRTDRVSETDGILDVRLAAEPRRSIVANVTDMVGLIGFAEVGGHGLGIVVAGGNGTPVGVVNWTVYAVRDGGLATVGFRVPVHGVGRVGPALGQIPGRLVSWISPRGVAMSALLDPSQHDDQHLSVKVRRYVPERGGLRQEAAGVWCWDTATQELPAPCGD